MHQPSSKIFGRRLTKVFSPELTKTGQGDDHYFILYSSLLPLGSYTANSDIAETSQNPHHWPGEIARIFLKSQAINTPTGSMVRTVWLSLFSVVIDLRLS